jgi:hypothetical protein
MSDQPFDFHWWAGDSKVFVRDSMNNYSMLHGEVCVRSSSIENNTSINIG